VLEANQVVVDNSAPQTLTSLQDRKTSYELLFRDEMQLTAPMSSRNDHPNRQRESRGSKKSRMTLAGKSVERCRGTRRATVANPIKSLLLTGVLGVFSAAAHAYIGCTETVTNIIMHSDGVVYFQTDQTCGATWCSLSWSSADMINKAYAMLLSAQAQSKKVTFAWSNLPNCQYGQRPLRIAGLYEHCAVVGDVINNGDTNCPGTVSSRIKGKGTSLDTPTHIACKNVEIIGAMRTNSR